jgi:dihydrodipicolinate reductase
LPRDTVAALAGKMAHPVNLPVSDEKGLVIRGHAIMQPRVTPSLTTGAEASVFQRAFSANRGLDPYVFAVSDLYQDLFGQGSFTGKGIYDVDAFQAAMTARVPENAILSHDLLEGSLARAALVSDIEVVETHHRMKVDAPSGTALMLGEAAAEGRGASLTDLRIPAREGITGARAPGGIGFAAIRGGDVVGEHDVIFATPGERLVLRHLASDRAIFARGAIRAALWGQDKGPGQYDMADVLGLT